MLIVKEYEVDIWLWTETNINWTPKPSREADKMGYKVFNSFKIITSASNGPAGWKQPGGSCIDSVNGMVGWKMQGGEDKKGLGRWNYVQIAGRDQRQVIFVSAYKPCTQSNEGASTVTVQHKHILTLQGDHDANSRKAFNQDLMRAIRQWQEGGNTVVVGIDANSKIDDDEVTMFLAETKMYDLAGAKHGKYTPNQHINETHAVNFLFVTTNAIDPTNKIGMLPFQCGIDSDYRAIICDIKQ
eukprot:13455016-Ditylum_brightwellii.AAC.1